MKKFILGSGFVTIAILFTFFVLTGCSKKEDDEKIAITTMSSEAKNDFVEGRNLFEKLQQRESLQYFENAFADDNRFAMAYYYHSLANPTTKGFFEDLDNADTIVPREEITFEEIDEIPTEAGNEVSDLYSPLLKEARSVDGCARCSGERDHPVPRPIRETADRPRP